MMFVVGATKAEMLTAVRKIVPDHFLLVPGVGAQGGSLQEVAKYGLTKEQYEFQMLLGVREKRRDQIVKDGHRLRIYVPFGEQWYAYSTRRLQENPQMAWYITKAIFIH